MLFLPNFLVTTTFSSDNEPMTNVNLTTDFMQNKIHNTINSYLVCTCLYQLFSFAFQRIKKIISTWIYKIFYNTRYFNFVNIIWERIVCTFFNSDCTSKQLKLQCFSIQESSVKRATWLFFQISQMALD